ncbi:MAG: hypothetical protein PHC34_12460 [Candidatus Gastranaerophilales bacterium]|nr:hypothetical protein [Candidatus Gastranaerophilales bacterium]
MQSLHKVHSGEESYSPFWMENKTFDDNLISDFWIKKLNQDKNTSDLNKALRSVSEDQINNLKKETIICWFEKIFPKHKDESAVDNQIMFDNVNYSKQLDPGLKKVLNNYKENRAFCELMSLEESLYGENTVLFEENASKTLRDILRKEKEITEKFNKNLLNPILNFNSTPEEKQKACEIMFLFLDKKLKTDSTEEAKETLEAIDEFKNACKKGYERKNIGDTKESWIKLYKITNEYWFKNYFPKLMEGEVEKMLFVEKAFVKKPELRSIKSLNGFTLDQKYFVAKYYENQKHNFDKDDPMEKILTDRTILDKAQIIDEMIKKEKVDTDIFSSLVNEMSDIIKYQIGTDKLETYKIGGRNKEEETDLLSLYLQTTGQNSILLYPGAKAKKIESLEKIPEEEFILIADKLKRDWKNIYLPAKTDKEVELQSYKSSTHVQMLDELKKVNINLDDIKLKLDNITINIVDAVGKLDNIYLKFDDLEKSISSMQQQSHLKLESMQDGLDNLSPEESRELLKAWKEQGGKLTEIFIKNTKDEPTKKMFSDLNKSINNANNPRDIVNALQNYLPISISSNLVGQFFNKVKNNSHNLLGHTSGAMALQAPTEIAVQNLDDLISPEAQRIFADFTQGSVMGGTAAGLHEVLDPDVVNSSLAGAAGTTTAIVGAKAVGAAGGIKALGASLMTPQTAAIALFVASLYSIYRGNKLNQQFTDMYFGE